jgi:hypothetical protein
MRDLLFKNLTSLDKKRKIISTCEVADKEGIRTIIRRHFVCMVRRVEDNKVIKPAPYLYVLKERQTREAKETFLCKIKNSVFVTYKDELYLVLYMQTLKISLEAVAQGLAK